MRATTRFPRSPLVRDVLAAALVLGAAGSARASGPLRVEAGLNAPVSVSAVALEGGLREGGFGAVQDRQVVPVRRGEVVVTRLVSASGSPRAQERDDSPGGGTGGMLLVTGLLLARMVSRRG